MTTRTNGTATRTGTAAGVPYLLLPPADGDPGRPLVATWHLLDPPRTEEAMAAALPMHGLAAWRLHLGLPMTGARALPGGDEEFFGLGFRDAVLLLNEPIQSGAAAEFPAALAAVRAEHGLDAAAPLGLVGGSAGSAVAQLVVAEGSVPVQAAALVSPVVTLRGAVAASEELFEITYPWSAKSAAVADRFDFLARVGELGGAAVLIVVGELDHAALRGPAEELGRILGERDADRAALVVVPGLAHALAEEVDGVATPLAAAGEVDRAVVDWMRRHLDGAR